MNQEYLNKLIKEKNIVFIQYTSFAKLEGRGHKKYLLLERFPFEIKEDKIVYKNILTYSPCIKEGDILLTDYSLIDVIKRYEDLLKIYTNDNLENLEDHDLFYQNEIKNLKL